MAQQSSRKRSRPVQKQNWFEQNKKVVGITTAIIAVLILVIILVVYFPNQDNGMADDTNPIAVFDTSMGTFKIELFIDNVPITAGNFVNLSEDGFYDGTLFHRISPNFMIQGGDPNSKDGDPSNDGTGGPGYTIKDEFHPDLKNERGMISMANSGPDTGGSQFFILVEDAPWLDNHHAVFGQVIEGMNVVDDIANAPNDGRYEPNPGGGRPIEDIIVNSIVIQNNR